MDYRLQFDRTHHAILITFGRVITKASVLAVHEAIESLVAAHGPCARIVDLSTTVKSELSPQFVRSLAAVSPAIPADRRKILVAPEPETYGLSRLFQVLREQTGDAIRIVYSLEEAYEALGIATPDFRIVGPAGPETGVAAS